MTRLLNARVTLLVGHVLDDRNLSPGIPIKSDQAGVASRSANDYFLPMNSAANFFQDAQWMIYAQALSPKEGDAQISGSLLLDLPEKDGFKPGTTASSADMPASV